jgi:hypothetical protein
LHTTLALIDDNFYQGLFKVESFNPYEVVIKSTKDNQTYRISWG